ncbi:uncharacterized protein LOC135462779 [Liolophura sinensis]|uniref:uncharacterized protein LOC135462779 n=1 Tax=Liolophura sinensis TaxID=3198878 RepID=UPI00315954FC
MCASKWLMMIIQSILISSGGVDAVTTTIQWTVTTTSVETTTTRPSTTVVDLTTTAGFTTVFPTTFSSDITTDTSETLSPSTITVNPVITTMESTSTTEDATTDPIYPATTFPANSRATTNEFESTSTVETGRDNSTVTTCEQSTQIEDLEGRLVAVTALAAGFGVTSAILLVLLIFLHRGTIAFKLRQLCNMKQRPSELRNRNQLQMDHRFGTNSHIYTDLRRELQGENLESTVNDAPVYVNSAQVPGDAIYVNTGTRTGTFTP